jgi:N-acetylglutamate synthase-like GNAT family acetyltransferase
MNVGADSIDTSELLDLRLTGDNMTLAVRAALPADAVAACDVLRRSIRELCVADHGNNEKVLSAWLLNKTPRNVRAWISSPTHFAVVAVENRQVSGFGLIQQDGEIQLCYVSPDIQHRGAGKLLLTALEQQAARWNLQRVFLTSSVTARRFYERSGYSKTDRPISVNGLRDIYPMTKNILPASGWD